MERAIRKAVGWNKRKAWNSNNAEISHYQLQVIKRKKIYPEIGDIFTINPKDNIYFKGIVINNHIDNMNGEDLLLILIFKQNVDIYKSICNGVREDELLKLKIKKGEDEFV